MIEASGDDLSLLQRFEPVVRFTHGELFFPTDVEPYVRHASLWEIDGGARCIARAGELSIDRLVEESIARPGADLSLRFVDAPLDRRAYRAWRKRDGRPGFRSEGRFTQVGLIARLIDALFRLSLLLRGRVPGGLAAAAEVTSRQDLDSSHHPYYGRVVRDGGYVALQYWFFYAMNDWRSSFGGANDHEADWEQVTIYLVPDPDVDGNGQRPLWVAFSAHDEIGDDLRRRWDDPELVREGDHPVVFAGAGSHSGAFVAGEYVTSVKPPGALKGILGFARKIAHLVTPWSRGEIATGVGIPFVDYSRGDGEVIGPDHARTWTAVVITDATPWVRHFRGLWGLDTRDRFGGERAPAGPRYERGGVVRQSWSDPIGWAGLHKVPVSAAEAADLLQTRIADIDETLAALDADITGRRVRLRELEVAVESMSNREGLRARGADAALTMATLERELNALVEERTALNDERTAHVQTIAHPPPVVAPQAHIRHKHLPFGRSETERDRFLRVWSTISTPLLFLAAAALIVNHQLGVIVSVTVCAVVFLTFEAIARGRLVAYAVSMIGLIVAVLVVYAIVQGVLGEWRLVVAALLAAVGAAVLVANLRDLRRG